MDDFFLFDLADLVLALVGVARAKSYLEDSLLQIFILALLIVLPKQVMGFGYNRFNRLLFLHVLEYFEHISPKRCILLRIILFFELPIQRDRAVYLRLIDYFEVIFFGHVEQTI